MRWRWPWSKTRKPTIVEIDEPPNSQETIDRKGSDNPMIDTGQFLNSQRALLVIPGVASILWPGDPWPYPSPDWTRP